MTQYSLHRRLMTLALATAFGVTPVVAHAAGEDNVGTEQGTPLLTSDMNDTIKKAYNGWVDDISKVALTFPTTNVQKGDEVKNVHVVSTDSRLLGAASQDPDIEDQIRHAPPLGDIDEPVNYPTPAKTDNGDTVMVLPHGDSSAGDGSIMVNDVALSVPVNVGDSNVSFPIDPNSVSLAYETSSGVESGHNLNDMPTAQLPIAHNILEYAGKKGNFDANAAAINPLVPDEVTKLAKSIKLDEKHGQLESIIEPYVSAPDEETDKADGREDGLTPLTDDSGQKVSDKQTIDAGQAGVVRHDIEFTTPDEGRMIYLNHRIVDEQGRSVSLPGMDAFAVTDASIDVQASTENASSQLKDQDKQRIFNSVQATQLQPGQPYQILVKLLKCNGHDDCHEVAAVNREIIPSAMNRVENFSVDVDTAGMDRDSGTYEWETRVYEGTGDVHNMGKELASVSNHPSSQVLSFSGTQSSNMPRSGGKQDEEQAAVTTVMQDDRAQAETETEGQPVIGNDAPPASIDDVRHNNDMLEREKEKANHNWQFWAWVVGVIAMLAVGVILARRGTFTRHKPDEYLATRDNRLRDTLRGRITHEQPDFDEGEDVTSNE